MVYVDKPQTLDHLEDNIRRVIADIRPQMLEKVIENWTSRLDYIRASRGSSMPEIIFKAAAVAYWFWSRTLGCRVSASNLGATADQGRGTFDCSQTRMGSGEMPDVETDLFSPSSAPYVHFKAKRLAMEKRYFSRKSRSGRADEVKRIRICF
ncbi:hypothetical protein TNCV_5078781 [Trichonephila clavipes]|nr:hypothetical protein TNCV_5078781 [Trichonephila clavipes]